MPAAKRPSSSSGRSRASAGRAAAKATTARKTTTARKATTARKTTSARKATPARKATTTAGKSSARKPSATTARKPTARSATKRTTTTARPAATRPRGRTSVADNLASLAEQLSNRIIKPMDLVMLTRERIQETLDEAAERGRVTRGDANELVSELVKRGRKQTDDLLGDFERMLGRGRSQLESARRRARRSEGVDRVVRSADRARRSVGVGPSFPILGYDDLTAGQVEERLKGLSSVDLRKVRDYERRHANRKSVLAAVEKSLA